MNQKAYEEVYFVLYKKEVCVTEKFIVFEWEEW